VGGADAGGDPRRGAAPVRRGRSLAPARAAGGEGRTPGARADAPGIDPTLGRFAQSWRDAKLRPPDGGADRDVPAARLPGHGRALPGQRPGGAPSRTGGRRGGPRDRRAPHRAAGRDGVRRSPGCRLAAATALANAAAEGRAGDRGAGRAERVDRGPAAQGSRGLRRSAREGRSGRGRVPHERGRRSGRADPRDQGKPGLLAGGVAGVAARERAVGRGGAQDGSGPPGAELVTGARGGAPRTAGRAAPAAGRDRDEAAAPLGRPRPPGPGRRRPSSAICPPSRSAASA
jgi:hypothetical protein